MPRPSHLSIELLETFSSVVRHDGDAGQAARALHINQPSMSKRLKHLKDSGKLLSHAWLKRNGKRWNLTDEGRRIWPAVQELLTRYHQLQHFSTASAPLPPQPALRFACGQTAAVQLVRDALSEWRSKWPDLPIRVSTMRDGALVEGVASGALDMALVSHDEREIHEISHIPMDLDQIATYGFLAVCAPDAPWAAAFRKLPNVVPLKALAPFPLIAPEPDSHTRQALDHTITRRKLVDQMRIVVETGGWLTILTYVAGAHGVGIISEAAEPFTKSPALLVRRIETRDLPPQHLKLLTRKGGDKRENGAATPIERAWRDALLHSEKKRASRGD